MTNDDIFWFRFAVRSAELQSSCQPWVMQVDADRAAHARSSKIMKMGGSAARALAVVTATMGMALSTVIVDLRTRGVVQHRPAAPSASNQSRPGDEYAAVPTAP